LADEVEEGLAVAGELAGADAVEVGELVEGFGRGGGEGVEGFLGEDVVGGDVLGGGLFGAPGAEGVEEGGVGGGGGGIEVGAGLGAAPLGFRAGGGVGLEGGGGAGGKDALDVEAVGAGADAGELDARFGRGFFAGIEELAADGLVVDVEIGVGEGFEDAVEELVLEIAGGLLEAFAEGGVGFGVGVAVEQAVDLEEEFFADGEEVGAGGVVEPAEAFDGAGRRLARWRSASSRRALSW
jgi:hypothetical protein